ncbi:ESPR-type extended signal peptide-containing protein, partial [Burkholderia cenocepacia]|uniref:ESPR-type extended signal peptide-containing protein n=1 Tax=Burkholderia cenocepacia TaxID=95486 RepID=UPI00285E4F6B
MNKSYRNIWNAATNTWTAVAETAKTHSKGSSRAARQAVIAIALGSAAIGSAAAANVCTTADGSSGTVDAAGVCKAAGSGSISTMGSVGTMAALDDAYIKVLGTTAATATATGAIAIGDNAIANSSGSAYATIAIGRNANAGLNSLAVGGGAISNSRGVAIGGAAHADLDRATAVGYQASASAANAIAVGSQATAQNTNSIALGNLSVTNRDDSVSVGSATLQRQITNVAAGTQDTDAVNFGQVNTALSTKVDDTYFKVNSTGAAAVAGTTDAIAIGAGATVFNGGVTNPSGSIAIGSGASAAGSNSIMIGTNTRHAGSSATVMGGNASAMGGAAAAAFGYGSSAAGNASVALGSGATAGNRSSVALGSGSVANADYTVSVGSDAFQRRITNLDDGTAETDAVNVRQMNAGLSTTNAAIAATNAQLSTTNTTLAATNATLSTTNTQVAALNADMTAAKKDIASHTDDISKINGQLAGLSDGSIGLVQQSVAGADLTVGANTDGAAVNFSSKTGTRKLTGITAGDVSETSTEAVNGSQLHGVADSVASAIGGGSTVNDDGSISAPTFTVGDGSGGTKVVNSVGGAVANLDGRVTNNEGKITDLAEQIGSGTVGLVQQAAAGDDITVGANTDGAAVNFSSKTGTRKLTGITAGDVSKTSTEAVNGSQLHGVADSVASAIGGDSTVNADGSISAPTFTVGDGSGGTKVVNSVGGAVTNLNDRVTNNEGGIKDLAEQIGSGTVGLVQQASPGDDITVGANTGGAAVNFASKTGTRKLTGITAGDVSETSTEAVNGSQLHGVADSVASAIGGGSTVNDDGSISAPTFTVGDGSGGTKVVNSVGGAVTNLNDRVTNNEGGIKDLA